MDTILTKLFTKWNIQCGNDMEASYIEAGGLWTIGYLAYGLGGEGGGGAAPPPPPPQSHGLDPVLHIYPSSRLTPHPSSAYLWWRFWMEEIHSRHHFFFREGVVKKSHAYAR